MLHVSGQSLGQTDLRTAPFAWMDCRADTVTPC
jgi:hypothetical protein